MSRAAGPTQAERRVAVGDEKKRVRLDAQAPPTNADDVVEERPWVSAGEKNREPGDDDRQRGPNEERGINTM